MGDETDRLQVPLAPTELRYIKLGEGGAFAAACIEAGELGLAFANIPHEACARGDWEAVRAMLLDQGRSQATASRQLSELRDFYELGADTLWITFADGLLWWCFAAPGVAWREGAMGTLPRRRATMGSWRCESIAGTPLRARALSTRLTCVAGYRGALCAVKARDYLLRKLNAETEPLIEAAEAARAALHGVAVQLIRDLHEKEFELLVDLIFAGAGWRRLSVLGETEKDVDLLLEQPATGERIFAQVKSRATPTVLNDYVDRFRAYPDCDRMVFACHSPSPALAAHAPIDKVELWLADALTAKALRAGLLDWLIERVR